MKFLRMKWQATLDEIIKFFLAATTKTRMEVGTGDVNGGNGIRVDVGWLCGSLIVRQPPANAQIFRLHWQSHIDLIFVQQPILPQIRIFELSRPPANLSGSLIFVSNWKDAIILTRFGADMPCSVNPFQHTVHNMWNHLCGIWVVGSSVTNGALWGHSGVLAFWGWVATSNTSASLPAQ